MRETPSRPRSDLDTVAVDTPALRVDLFNGRFHATFPSVALVGRPQPGDPAGPRSGRIHLRAVVTQALTF